MALSLSEFKRFVKSKGLDTTSSFWQTIYDQAFAHLTPLKKPRLIIIAGTPGSGKSTFRKRLFKKNAFLWNMDEMITRLPEYEENLEKIGPAKLYRKQWLMALLILNLLLQYAIKSRYSIIYDGTCASKQALSELRHCKKQGYDVHLIGLYANRTMLRERVLRRAKKDKVPSLSPSLLKGRMSGFSALWPSLLKLADRAELYCTDSTPPLLVFSSKKGILNPSAYQAFLQKGMR